MRSSRSSVLSPWKNGFKYRPDYKPRNMHRQESRSLIILVLRRGGDARTLQRSPSQRPHRHAIGSRPGLSPFWWLAWLEISFFALWSCSVRDLTCFLRDSVSSSASSGESENRRARLDVDPAGEKRSTPGLPAEAVACSPASQPDNVGTLLPFGVSKATGGVSFPSCIISSAICPFFYYFSSLNSVKSERLRGKDWYRRYSGEERLKKKSKLKKSIPTKNRFFFTSPTSRFWPRQLLDRYSSLTGAKTE